MVTVIILVLVLAGALLGARLLYNWTVRGLDRINLHDLDTDDDEVLS